MDDLLVDPPPTSAEVLGPVPAELEEGRELAFSLGCLACHQIGGAGNADLGGELSTVGAQLSREEIERAVVNGPSFMPSYDALPRRDLEPLLDYLAALK